MSRVNDFARQLATERTTNVRNAVTPRTDNRLSALAHSLGDPEAARDRAAAIKDDVLTRLPSLLSALESKCRANGIQVHHAADAASACETILAICHAAAPKGAIIAKGKSMVTEEIHLNEHLEAAGYHPIETDLGEFIIQIDRDTPSHIVMPIIHKNRHEVGASFRREGIGDTDDATELTLLAREHLRSKFRDAQIGISGVNFAIASTGRLVIVENEGNNRLSTTVPPVHIAVMGMEKLLPTEADLALFLPLLAGSATNQPITTYVHFLTGPRQVDELDGPTEVHLVILDNGRSAMLDGPYRDALKCIRCAACLNACPVYRQATGHGYGHVYPGPIGAVLAPQLDPAYADLARASTLCGLCEEVCPVKIPIPAMLLQLRAAQKNAMPWAAYAFGATRPSLWRTGLRMLPMAGAVPHPLKSNWLEFRDLPRREGREFRSWWASEGVALPPGEEGVPRLAGGRAVDTVNFASTSLALVSLGYSPLEKGGEQNSSPCLQGEVAADHRDDDGGGMPQTPPLPSPLPQGGEGALPTSPTASGLPQNWGTLLQDRFMTAATAAGARIIDADELAALLTRPLYAEPATHASSTSPIWDAEVGYSVADFGIAETGSIVVSAGHGHARLGSLVPPVNVVRVQRIVGNLSDAIDTISASSSVIITGPSRTADIEGVLVRGIHGPRELLIYIEE